MPTQPSRTISNAQIRSELASYEVSVHDSQLGQIQEYVSLLLQWNRSIGLTAITDPASIVRRHFGESIFAARLLAVENCRLADVGTGAGFPGLALKIAVPSIFLTLIESNKKKCAFLAEVVRTLRLENIEIRGERYEGIRPADLRLNIVTSRAVGDSKELLRWSEGALLDRGHVLLWVGAEESVRLTSLSGWTWQPAVRIPESQRRYVLIGRPIAKS